MDKPKLSDLLIDAIEKARDEQQGSLILLNLSQENGLGEYGRTAVLDALADFQRQTGAIRLSEINFPERQANRTILAGSIALTSPGHSRLTVPISTPAKLSPAVLEFLEEPSKRQGRVLLGVLPSFDNLVASYRLRTRDDLEQITPLTLAKVCLTVLDIAEKLEASGQPTMNIYARFHYTSPFFPQNFVPSDYRKDALEYMKNRDIVTQYQIHYLAADGADVSSITVGIDIPKFQAFKARVGAVYLAKERELAPPPSLAPEAVKSRATRPGSDTDAVYEVTLTDTGEILINEFLLSRPNFDSENQNIFEYVFDRPNQTILLEELRQALDGELPKKSLPKIVDNWGFTRELKKLFFRVSAQSIYFRNPVRQKDLEMTKVGRLSISRR